eukprot:6469901-Lingulodinium_polyedra.AAC.1
MGLRGLRGLRGLQGLQDRRPPQGPAWLHRPQARGPELGPPRAQGGQRAPPWALSRPPASHLRPSGCRQTTQGHRRQ